MYLSNKGFAISGILYASLILFVTLMLGILLMASNRKVILDKERNLVLNEFGEYENNSEDIYRDGSGAPAPELSEGMIPVLWDGSKWIKTSLRHKWYNYFAKNWANAVLVSSTSRNDYLNASPGTTIDENDVLAYLVWIPRYRYKLFNVDSEEISPQEIEIIFEDKNTPKSTGSNDDEWLTHPAFTFGNDELNGIWVGKFETTGDAETPTIKPGEEALVNQKVSVQFVTAQKFNNRLTYGLTNSFDAHLMKNIEWGAVAYLSHGQYGKGVEEVGANKTIYTGGGNLPTSYISNDEQSTTGNVYGVYDMSGGNFESVMGVMLDEYNVVMELDATFTSSGINLNDADMGKYIDKYVYGGADDYDRRILGDATSETMEWYDDYDCFIRPTHTWFLRGGYYDNDDGEEGAFAFNETNGRRDSVTSFRIVVSGK